MIADIVIIAVMALCIFLGYKRGLIKVAVRIVSFFAALIIALVLYTPISNYIIENTEIVPTLKNTIEAKLYTEEKNEGEDAENKNLSQTVGSYINEYTDEIKENTSEVISEQTAITVVRVGTWIGLFIVSKIIMLFIRVFADAIASLPIIKQFNKAGRNNIWNTRRLFGNICISCNFKHGISNDRRKSYKSGN